MKEPEKAPTFQHKVATLIQNLRAPKGQFNAFGKYKYRSCEDILEAVKPHLNGLVILVSDEIIEIANRVYVKATAKITDLSGLEIQTSAYAREPEAVKGMSESQITGMASSYARKYALNGLLNIDDAKDADTMDNSKTEKTAHEDKKVSFKIDTDRITSHHANEIRKLCKLVEDGEKRTLAFFSKKNQKEYSEISDLDQIDYEVAKNQLTQLIKKQSIGKKLHEEVPWEDKK